MVERGWDEFVESYDRIFLENPLYNEAIKTIVLKLEGCGDCAVAEIGCGTGNLMQAISVAYPSAGLYGIDPSADMLEKCARKFGNRDTIELEKGGAERIPYGSDKFDYVVANYALHHLQPGRIAATVREVTRVLKPGGMFINSDFFVETEALPPDIERVREIITKLTGQALYYLDHGAYEAMLLLLDVLPSGVRGEGDIFTTTGAWIEPMRAERFDRFELTPVGPEEFGLKVITAIRM
ncbi:MAG: class I SAM-dependent methyltransferase [Actinobacteria bacterium]|nr:class I SAM-dependent methyltransferase [Actinomycetota bacterium]